MKMFVFSPSSCIVYSPWPPAASGASGSGFFAERPGFQIQGTHLSWEALSKLSGAELIDVDRRMGHDGHWVGSPWFSYFDWRPFVIGVFLTAPTTRRPIPVLAEFQLRWLICGREFKCNDFTVSFPGLDCPNLCTWFIRCSFVVHSLSQQFSFLASSTSLFLQAISCPAGNWLATSRNWSPAGPLMQLGWLLSLHVRKGRWTL